MVTSKENKSIQCSVTNCANHSCNSNCCGLDKIQIGTHEANPAQPQCTDCQSFKMK